MARKAAIVKNYKLSAQGILVNEGGILGIENVETGELINMSDLLADFSNKTIKLSVSYDEDFGTTEEVQGGT